ncbi:S8 family peptidase [Abyssalbus ytuae]|uniref:S8/S53 family peptidase n=1 Tax=Abyssalbus ytuae TaxID=2926907 RepID=A0A9E7A228_9FLAO|nr:S8 family serine peptidase [Abyssalbus ytuae]UOB18336.1 S8/S53 family peptidase [Abyssalbus ytuae]
MRKLVCGVAVVSALFITSCSKDNLNSESGINTPEISEQKDPLSVDEINRIINEILQREDNFHWNDVSDFVLWSALKHGDNILTIGYGTDKNDYSNKGTASQKSSKDKIISFVKSMEDKIAQQKGEDVLIYDDEFLTIIDMKVEKLETIKELRSEFAIRYMEPSGYSLFQNEQFKPAKVQASSSSSSGCGLEGESLNSSDYVTVVPNSKMPWNFYAYHNIDEAWSHSTGSGITIGIVDTGASTEQSLLNGSFNNGYSSGRTIERKGVYVDSWWPWSTETDGVNDKCGHGTSMTSVAGAPRNDKGQTVGVAYNSNFVVYRAASNVVLDGYHEQKGVARAFTELGDRSDVDIISMSMGHIISVGRIEDAIKYAYSKGKLIFCAGGTSTSFTNFVGVIFPAWMSETVAVTGIEENSVYNVCDTCHEGNEIDFAIVMERANNNHVPVLGYYNNQADYVGGSSVAAAMAAGIGALVWAEHPGWTRTQVLNKLISSSHLYPNKNSSFGWGVMDALKAVQ